MTPFLNIAVNFIIFFALGFAGFFILEKLKVPAPAILGPLLAVGIAGFFGLRPELPALFRPFLSIILGIILGLRVNVKTTGLVKIILMVSVWLAGLTLLAVWLLTVLGIDRATAFFASLPGGFMEITLMALSAGTDTFVVTLLQISRMLLTLLVIPVVAQFMQKRIAARTAEAVIPAADKTAPVAAAAPLKKIDWIAFAVLGVSSAWIFNRLHIPASNIMGSMFAVGIYTKLRHLKVRVNSSLQKFIQIGVGGLVSLSIPSGSAANLLSYIMPLVVLNLIIIGGSLVLALVLFKITGWDIITCLFATAPGGMTPMILLAMEMKANSQVVAIFQVLRMVLVLIFASTGPIFQTALTI